MRKRIGEEHAARLARTSDEGWLILDRLATVEVTSEQEAFPIESVFAGNGREGWRASGAGEQVIRLVFDRPVSVDRIQLRFEERDAERTQEFTLSWCPSMGGCREIVRQQWTFSPNGSTREIENYEVNLAGVRVLELSIKPEISGGNALASLAAWRIA